jgi:hypothetical protein
MKLEPHIINKILNNTSNKFYALRYIKFLEKNEYLIEDCKANPELKFALHHGCPKALFPDLKDNYGNLFYLTYRAHFIAHKLLVKVFNTNETWRALWFMTNNDGGKLTSKLYAELRKTC